MIALASNWRTLCLLWNVNKFSQNFKRDLQESRFFGFYIRDAFGHFSKSSWIKTEFFFSSGFCMKFCLWKLTMIFWTTFFGVLGGVKVVKVEILTNTLKIGKRSKMKRIKFYSPF